MRQYDYLKSHNKLIDVSGMSKLSRIYEEKGKLHIVEKYEKEKLEEFRNNSKLLSIAAVSKLDGMGFVYKKMKEILDGSINPSTDFEGLLLGYGMMVDTIERHYEYMGLTSSNFSQMHRELNKYILFSKSGYYSDEGKSEEVDVMLNAYSFASSKEGIEKLILIFAVAYDFMCLKPFNNSNMNMYFLLIRLLMYKNGFFIGRYVSIEAIIEKRKEEFANVLKLSGYGWSDGMNDLTPYTNFMLDVILSAYKEFDIRVRCLDKKISKPMRVEYIIKNLNEDFDKRRIKNMCPDVSDVTIEKTLGQLVRDETIIKIGNGRCTYYQLKT